MNIREFSDQFDTLLDSYKFKDEFGEVENIARIKLDEYEKSVLLTEAQDIILRQNFTPQFDRSEQGQIYFGNLITVGTGIEDTLTTPYAHNGQVFTLPENIFWAINERIEDDQGNRYIVIPINYVEYDRILSKPYAKPLVRQAWRLYQGALSALNTPKAEIVMRNSNPIEKYLIRYIRKPKPIILENLGDLSIQGISTATECELNPLVHFEVLSQAVNMAVSRYNTGTSKEE